MKQEKVKLDEILKFLFNSSEKVLVKLLNSMFDENFKEDEVSVTITNSEFVEDTLEILRGDMFFKIFDKANKDFEKHKMNYHLEFQTKNDNTMIIRMFEYGFRKGKENANEGKDNIKRLYFPKQKVIFFEENKNIEDSLKLIIVFDNDKEFLYEVDVMKYWQYMEGNYEPQSPKTGKFLTIGLHDEQIHNVLRKQLCRIICINDTENIGDFQQQKKNIKESFECILPEKSTFER